MVVVGGGVIGAHRAAKRVNIRPFGLCRFAEGRPPEGPYPYTPRPDRAGSPGVVA